MAEINNENVGASTPSINRDTTMDIASLIKTAKKEEPTPTVTADASSVAAPEGKTEEAVKHKTKLEQMMEAKQNQTLGMIVDNDKLNHDENVQLKNKTADDAMSDADKYLADMDAQIDVAKKINFPRPENPQQMVGIMDALDRAAKNPDLLKTGEAPAEETPEETAPEENTSEDKPSDEVTPSADDAKKAEKAAKEEERKKVINILIDKTGFGADFHFSDEEKEKLSVAEEIRVKEVEDIDLATIKVKKPNKSFADSVNEYQLAANRVSVTFPLSRFRAYMTGLTYGEMTDLTLTTEPNNFDKLNKRLSIIYNKMVNPSCGKFDSYDDFLKKFAYQDIDLAIYGLIIATFPETDEIGMSCQNEKCKQNFTHRFNPRSLLRFDLCGDRFLKGMDEVINCPLGEETKIMEDAPCQVHKRVRLPYSKYILEIGFATAYEYLYDIMDSIDQGKFKERHPDDVNNVLADITNLLPSVHAVYVPDSDGSYICYTGADDIVEALYTVKPDEINLIIELMQNYLGGYAYGFSLTDVRCPHCGTLTKYVPLETIDSMLFRRYQRLRNTNLDVSNITE